MKTKIVKLVIFTIVSICASLPAYCQTNANGLAVIGTDASFVADTNMPGLFLTVSLLNTTNHDIVVFTKGLNGDFTRDDTDTNRWVCMISLDDSLVVTYQGHKVVPSFYGFAPVTIRPNEVAVVTHDVYLGMSHFSTNAPIIVHYSISPDWGSRFGSWIGSVTSKPFTVSGPSLTR